MHKPSKLHLSWSRIQLLTLYWEELVVYIVLKSSYRFEIHNTTLRTPIMGVTVVVKLDGI
jgi:hypothetical protein